MKYKLFPAPFFNHFIQPSPPPIAKLKSLHGVLRGQLPHKNGPVAFWLALLFHTMTSKSPSLQPIYSSKSYKYDKYNKTTYRVFPYC